MDKAEIEVLKKMIEDSENEIKNYLRNIECHNIVLLLGNTGAGKTTIGSILSGKEVLVKPRGRREAKFEFSGIRSGGKSTTRLPNIMIDGENDILFCDCPGFFDSNGYLQEIVNSFVIDFLLSEISNNHCKVKILLVIGSHETESARSVLVAEVFNRMENMFKKEQLQKGVGILFSKSEPNKDGCDYIDDLYDNAINPVDDWCEFFKDHEDRVFTFDKVTCEEIDKPYIYKDKDIVIEFLKNDQLINPVHSPSLGQNAKTCVEKLKNEEREKLNEIITKLFESIYELYSKTTSVEKISKGCEMLQRFVKYDIHNVNELKFIIIEHLPNNDVFSNYLKKLDEFQVLNTFIYRVIGSNNDKRIQKIFRDKANFTFSQLTDIKNHVISIENLKEFSAKQEQMVDNFKTQLEVQKIESNEIINKMEATIKELKDKQVEDIKKMKEIEEKNEKEMQRLREERRIEIEKMKEKMDLMFENDMIKKFKSNKIKSTIPWQLINSYLGITDEELGGILKTLSVEVGGNIHEYGFIQVTSNSINGEDFMPKNLLDFDSNNSYASRQMLDSYILFDFIDQRIQITSYILKRPSYSNVKNLYLQNWVIEVSNDNSTWNIVDTRNNCDALCNELNICVFNLKQPTNDFYRYVRLRQIGDSSNDENWNYIFGLTYIDFYGRMTRPQFH